MPQVQFPAFPKHFREKIVDIAEVYQWHCLEGSGQWLENADQTYLVLASGKLVLLENIFW